MDILNTYFNAHKERFLNELLEWLRYPSVSADPAYKEGVMQSAAFLRDRFIEAGADNVALCPTKGNPIVYGEKIIDKNLPTVLVYGHYDVQPPDPLDLWHSPPFEPVIKDEKIYARGACDDKGQAYMHVKAFEMMMQTNNVPCNVKFLIEGEEEVGSGNLEAFVKANKEKLACDVILISDTSIINNQTPSITTGLRGIVAVEVELTGPNIDLHSGTYGGAVANPLNIMCKLIGSLHDENNHITIPGFYDNVEVVSDAERAEMAKAPFSLDAYKNYLNIADVHGEAGFTTNERTSIRPTLDVNGMWGGYQGEGSKTVLPSKAYAKVTMRLVPHQSSSRIARLFKEHLENITPPSVKIKVSAHHGGEAYVTPVNSIGYKAAAKAMETTFGKSPIPVREGGSIPIVAMFEKELDSKSILLGFGLHTDAIHSPNEHYGLFNFYKGIQTIPYFYKYYTELKKG